MDGGSFLLWLAWTGFGTCLVALLWKRYLPAVLRAPLLPPEPAAAPPAWLFCEEGSALDRRVRWFALRPGGRTILGSRPRAEDEEAFYLYLSADDVLEEHAAVQFHPESGRYTVAAIGSGPVRHNNEPLPPGDRAEMADGDTLDVGRISRFRYTLTGPEVS